MRSLKLAPAVARAIVRELLETADPETDTDELASPRQVYDWLTERGLLEDGVEVTLADFQRMIALREALRQFLADGKANPETVATLNWIASRALVRPRVGRRADLWMEPAVEGFDGALARLLLIHDTSQSKGPAIRKRRPSVSDRWLWRKTVPIRGSRRSTRRPESVE